MLLKEQQDDSDAQLLEGFRRGDIAAFDDAVARYKDGVYNLLFYCLGNHEDAGSIALEVFVRAFQRMQTLKQRGNIQPWLYGIALDLVRIRLRDERGRIHAAQTAAMEVPRQRMPDTRLAGVTPPELGASLKECLQALPEYYRNAFVLCMIDTLPYGLAAEAMNCAVGTVKSRLNHALQLLHVGLVRQGLLGRST